MSQRVQRSRSFDDNRLKWQGADSPRSKANMSMVSIHSTKTQKQTTADLGMSMCG